MLSKIKQFVGLTLVGLSVSSLAFAVPATAGTICKVTDPTGTRLNIRSFPGGGVVGTIRNGTRVRIFETTRDERGKQWVNIGSGWVVREFIACYQQ
jgi:uncharacterized protein YraI